MSISQAAARVYAKALFDIAVEGEAVAQTSDELHAVWAAINGLDPDLQGFFQMPQLRREDKRHVINLAFEGKLGRPVLGLLNVLVVKRREPLLSRIVAEFDSLADQYEGRVRAGVTTARKLDPDLAEALRSTLEQRLRRHVVLRERVDPAVLGGMRVSVGDLVLDGTLRRALSDMRHMLAASQGSH